jgi:predicted adenine nucleotide alpha hydrolase (AANH) superfamily ATPase
LEEKMKTLLHICCANCAIIPVKSLRERGVELSGYFFNHNIHPYQEFRRRLETAQQYAEQVALPLICNEDYALDEFLANVAADPAKRCSYCYHSRLEETARYAAEYGFDAYSTSLLYSRYQQHDTIRASGEALGRHYGIDFLYEDFRTGWQEGIVVSKAMGLYRQQYCGCIYSERDRYLR